jgi:hypothetical protein
MALARLIDATEDRNEWSDRDVVRRAEAQDHRLNRQDITNYRHIGMKTIVPAKIKALAEGLGLPAYRVAQAVLEDHGIVLPMEARTPEDAIRHDHELPERTRAALLAILSDAR